ncbi:trichohyalin-like [Eriocheir sinensis]|uniref:trichohyalin-like n=1 Tax=Eriocheir sinensis TaxID=95602 RepID=UPI0021C934D0|nr:trichohyalin-like [Eriocheir sinensis]
MSEKEVDQGWITPRSRRGRAGGGDNNSGEESEYEAGGTSAEFSGFARNETTLYKRVLLMERKLDKWISMVKRRDEEEEQNRVFHSDLRNRIKRLEQNEKKLIKENEELKEKAAKYERSMKEGLGVVRKENENLKELVNKEEQRVREEVKTWRVENEKANVSLREVIEQQMKEDKEDVEKEVVKALKKNEELVREVADKKRSVIIFGMKEKNITYKPKRDKEELKSVKDLLKNLNDAERQSIEEEVDEIYRMGPFIEGKTRPVKLKLKSQMAAEDILSRTTKLKKTEGCKDIYIKKNRNEEERMK